MLSEMTQAGMKRLVSELVVERSVRRMVVSVSAPMSWMAVTKFWGGDDDDNGDGRSNVRVERF